jgi:hypothetical protein
MKRLALLLAILLAPPAAAAAQTRIDPPGPAPVFGPRVIGPVFGPIARPVSGPGIFIHGPGSRFDLLSPPSILWALVWSDGLFGDRFRGDRFREFAFGPFFGGRARFARGVPGGTRIEHVPGAWWSPFGVPGAFPFMTEPIGIDPYGNPVFNPAVEPSRSPYGPYAPWAPDPSNPYGTYAPAGGAPGPATPR